MTSAPTIPKPKLRYQQAIERIEAEIRSGHLRPGDRLPSFKGIGASMGINFLTARKAILELADRGLVEVRPNIGTFVRGTTATSARSQTLRIAFTYPAVLTEIHKNHPLVGACLEGAGQECRLPKCSLQVASYRDGYFVEDIGNALLEQGVNGILHVGAAKHLEYRDFAKAHRIPLVDFNRRGLPHDWAVSCLLDDTTAMRLAIEHLRCLGHQSVGYLCFADTTDGGMQHEVFTRLVMQHGLGNPAQALIKVRNPFDALNNRWGPICWTDVDNCFALDPMPTAFIVRDEFLADMLLRSCAARNIRVPRQLSVLALQDLWPVGHRMPLTTMFSTDDICQLAAHGGRLLLDWIAGKPVEHGPHFFKPNLIMKASTGIVPAASPPSLPSMPGKDGP